MSILAKKWTPLKQDFNKGIHDALQQQHYASQLIAMAGRHLIEQQADDSNTNMQYDSKRNLLIGNELGKGYHIALNLSNMYLLLLNKDFEKVKQFALEGKTMDKSFDILRDILWAAGIDVSKFKKELHYKIPKHPLAKNAIFTIDEEDYFNENAAYRSNAELILNEIRKKHHLKEDIKVWPHHFDTGSFIPIAHNAKGELIQSIGLGLAIPDSMVNEPYYYLSFWSAEPIKELAKPDELTVGNWMMPNWNGAILKQSDILKVKSASVQHQIVQDFYQSGIKILSQYFKI